MGCFHYTWRLSTDFQTVVESYCLMVRICWESLKHAPQSFYPLFTTQLQMSPLNKLLLLVAYRSGQFYIMPSQMPSVGFDINIIDDLGRTCLHAAASGG